MGSQYLLSGIEAEGVISEKVKSEVMSELKRHFKPEFLNRIDEIVMFKPLVKIEIIKIIELVLKDMQKRLDDRHINLNVTEKAKQFIADTAYSPVYGARPVKRYLQKFVETEIGKMIIKGELPDNSTIVIDVQDGKLAIRL